MVRCDYVFFPVYRSTGVFAILEMIKEDIEKELVETKKAEAEATAEYELSLIHI